MRKLSATMICVGMFLGLFLATPTPVHANPSTISLDLYGSFQAGWGNTSTSESSPGPHLSVHQGDTVTITLHSTDGIAHRFFIDYDANQAPSTGEPLSANFTTTTTITFTATQLGSFDYYCEYHPLTMKGDFVVQPSGSSGNPTTSGTGNTLLIVGAVVVVVAVAGVGALMLMRRKK